MKDKINARIHRAVETLKTAKEEARQLIGSPQSRRGALFLVILALVAGWLLAHVFQPPAPKGAMPEQDRGHEYHEQGDGEAEVWTCSMHPQIRMPQPGQCPICGMDLISVTDAAQTGMPSARILEMSPEAMKLAEIQTSRAERKAVAKELRMLGKVEYDEARAAFITAWVPGRLDRLYVAQTGLSVRKGDPLALIYSPQLLSAQEEYLQALEGASRVRDSHLDMIRGTAETTVENARRKLKLLGVTDAQISELEKTKQPEEHMTLYAPATGIVTEKKLQEGDYVQAGTRILAVADLEEVWVRLDAYEADLAWLRHGQEVTFEAEAYPGEFFTGHISFIEPVLNEMTRTVKIRMDVPNPDLRLKPGMFVRSVAQAPIWEEDDLPLVVPASAVLKTGKRAIVYVRVPDMERPTFEGREIILGPRAGDYYLVRTGLTEGEKVVTHGNFKIDSALQIQGKPSMMAPEGAAPPAHHHDHGHQHEGAYDMAGMEDETMALLMAPGEFLHQLQGLYDGFFAMQAALAADDLKGAQTAAGRMQTALEEPDMRLLEDDETHAAWHDLERRIQNSLVLAEEAVDLKAFRTEVLIDLARQMLSLQRGFGHAGEETHYEAYCPMVLDGKGALWLQREKEINNPFHGKSMLRCGAIRQEFEPA